MSRSLDDIFGFNDADEAISAETIPESSLVLPETTQKSPLDDIFGFGDIEPVSEIKPPTPEQVDTEDYAAISDFPTVDKGVPKLPDKSPPEPFQTPAFESYSVPMAPTRKEGEKIGVPEALVKSGAGAGAELAVNLARTPQTAAEIIVGLSNLTNRGLNKLTDLATGGKVKNLFGEIPVEKIGELTGFDEGADVKAFREYADKQKKSAAEVTNSKGVVDNLLAGDFANAGKSLGVQAAAQVPLIISMMVGGAAGVGAKGLAGFASSSEASSNMDQYWNDVEQGVARQDPSVAALNALVSGTIEGIGESLGTGRIIDDAIKVIAKRSSEAVAKKTTANALGTIVGKMMKAAGEEATEEAVVGYAQAVADKVFGKRDVTLIDAIKEGIEGGIVGAFASGGTTGPLVGIAESQRQQLESPGQTPPPEGDQVVTPEPPVEPTPSDEVIEVEEEPVIEPDIYQEPEGYVPVRPESQAQRREAVESGMYQPTVVDQINEKYIEKPTKRQIVEDFGVSREEAAKAIRDSRFGDGVVIEDTTADPKKDGPELIDGTDQDISRGSEIAQKVGGITFQGVTPGVTFKGEVKKKPLLEFKDNLTGDNVTIEVDEPIENAFKKIGQARKKRDEYKTPEMDIEPEQKEVEDGLRKTTPETTVVPEKVEAPVEQPSREPVKEPEAAPSKKSEALKVKTPTGITAETQLLPDVTGRVVANNKSYEPVLDLQKNDTGWIRPKSNHSVIMDVDGKRQIIFSPDNERSGTDAVRASMAASEYAIENPITKTPKPEKAPEIVTKPLIKKPVAKKSRKTEKKTDGDIYYSAEESRKKVEEIRAGDEKSKNKGRKSPEPETGELVETDIKISLFDQDQRDLIFETVDNKRVLKYRKEGIKTPIYAGKSNSGRWTVRDGGHRLVAAIDNGEKTIRALIPKELISEVKGELTPIAEKPITYTSKSVRDHNQSAKIRDGEITVVNRSGRKQVGKKSFPLKEWEKLEKAFGNPNAHKRRFVKKLDLVRTSDTPEGGSLRERIVDSQISAINKVVGMYRESNQPKGKSSEPKPTTEKREASKPDTKRTETGKNRKKEEKLKKEVGSVPRTDTVEKKEISKVDLTPSEPQKEAGNYRKAHIKRDGLEVSIENPAGSERSGTDRTGKKWKQKINQDYGYIKGTKGADAYREKGNTDQVDVFIKPDSSDGGPVYIVNQVDPATGNFDEHKVMMGFDSQEEAERAYLSNYEKGWKGLGSIVPMEMDQFKEWVYSSKTKDPVPVDDSAVKQKRLKETSDSAKKISKDNDLSKPRPGKKINIEDFGQKIGGARKDYYAMYSDNLKQAEEYDVAAEPLSKSWPEPNYKKMLESGSDPWVVGFIRAVRDEIPNKPKNKWRLSSWVRDVKVLRDMAEKTISGHYSKEILQDKIEKHKIDSTIGGRTELYQIFGHDKSFKGVRFGKKHYSFYNGEENVFKWEIEKQLYGNRSIFSNMPSKLGVGDTKEQAIEDFRKNYEEFLGKKKSAKKPGFGILFNRKLKKYYIGKKIGKDYVYLKEFDNRDDAFKYLSENEGSLSDMLERYKRIPSERRTFNRDRIGKDHRGGKDVTSEMFHKKFGFRGVEFGNWVNGEERQESLNRSYDALFDLANILNLTPKALSLNGQLGIGFGSRGHGGKSAPSAHYEPVKVVINLTKKNGPGSLAHEWWHALDNYTSRKFGKSLGYITEKYRENYEDQSQKPIRDAIAGLMKGLDGTGIIKRSKELDKTRTKEYWSKEVEYTARSFENYVIEKLIQQGATNDYLVNIATGDEYQKALDEVAKEGDVPKRDETYPYLYKQEFEKIEPLFDRVVEVLSGFEKDTGNLPVRRRGFLAETGAIGEEKQVELPDYGKESEERKRAKMFEKTMDRQDEDVKEHFRKPFTKRIRDTIDSLGEKFVDRVYYAKRLLGNTVEAQEIVGKINSSKGHSAESKGQYDDAEKEITKNLPYNLEKKFRQYLQAMRIIEIEKNKGQGKVRHSYGLTLEDAEAFVKRVENDLHPLQVKAIKASAEKFWKVMADQRKQLLDSGLLPKWLYDTLEKEGRYYSPRRYLQHIDPEQSITTPQGNRISVRDSGIKTLGKGSENATINNWRLMLSETITRTQSRIYKNRAAKSLADFVRKYPENDFGGKIEEPAGREVDLVDAEGIVDNLQGEIVKLRERLSRENTGAQQLFIEDKIDEAVEKMNKWAGRIKQAKSKKSDKAFIESKKQPDLPRGMERIYFMEDGEPKAILVPEKFAQSWNQNEIALNPSLAQFVNIVSGSALVRPLATGVLAPEFALSNIPRDMALQWLSTPEYSRIAPVALVQNIDNFRRVIKDAWTGEGSYRDYVKQGGGMEFLNEQGSFLVKDPTKTVTASTERNRQIIKAFTKLQEFSERLTRLALREQAIKNGKSPQEATRIAREYLDFAQGGSWTKAINNAIPYLNASVQGTRSVIRGARENPTLFAFKSAQLVTMGAALALAALKFREDEWENISEREKVNRWNFPIGMGYKNKFGKKVHSYLSIPKDQSSRIFATIGETAVERAAGKIDGETAWKRISMAFDDLSPVDAVGMLPPSSSAIIGYALNKNFWRRDDIWKGRKVSPYMEFHGRTPEFYKDAAAGLKNIGIELSPERLNQSLQQVMPANPVTALMGGAYESITGSLKGKEKEELNKSVMERFSKLPGVRKYLRSTYPSRSDYKKLIDKAEDYGMSLNDESGNRKAEAILKSEIFKHEKNIGDIRQRHYNEAGIISEMLITGKNVSAQKRWMELRKKAIEELGKKEADRIYKRIKRRVKKNNHDKIYRTVLESGKAP